MPSSKLPAEIPSQAEFGLMRAWLAQKGVKQAQIAAAIGDGQFTRAEIVAKLTDFCQKLPRGV